ncbi:MAG: DUF6266 family protein [Bacteroidales bacterium]|nr:DUF6266 family protein [Bacteroidales bacterium]
MAIQYGSYLGGFSGKLGPAIGYQRNGVWCMRSRPQHVRNPRTVRQMACRQKFKSEVQLAARMRMAVAYTLRESAREAHMTPYNLFVSLNQPCFVLDEGQLAVDYRRLTLSVGPAAPVALTEAVAEGGNILKVSFEKNPLGLSARAYDEVYLYVYAPGVERGFLSAPVYRRDRQLRVSLPDAFGGEELQLWLMVRNERGEWSPSVYGGSLVLTPGSCIGNEISVDEDFMSANTLVPHDKSVRHGAGSGDDGHRGAAHLRQADVSGGPDTVELALGQSPGTPHPVV